MFFSVEWEIAKKERENTEVLKWKKNHLENSETSTACKAVKTAS